MAATATIAASIYGIYKKVKKSWQSLQQKVERLETSLKVNQRGITNKDLTVSKDSGKLITIPKGSEVMIVSVDSNNLVTMQCFQGLLTTKTYIENIDVDSSV